MPTQLALHTAECTHLATVLDKELRRRITVGGVEYTIVLDPGGIRVLGKGKRRPEVELRWNDLLSGEAAMAVALNASLSTHKRQAPAKPAARQPGNRASQSAAQKRSR
jgi:hypothetical protein